MEREEIAEEAPGACPRCTRPVEWIPVDGGRHGRACRSCGWVELPRISVVRHTVGSLMRRILPGSHLTTLVEYFEMRRHTRREGK